MLIHYYKKLKHFISFNLHTIVKIELFDIWYLFQFIMDNETSVLEWFEEVWYNRKFELLC